MATSLAAMRWLYMILRNSLGISRKGLDLGSSLLVSRTASLFEGSRCADDMGTV